MIIVGLPNAANRRWIVRLNIFPMFEAIGQWDDRLKVFIPIQNARLTQDDIAALDKWLNKRMK